MQTPPTITEVVVNDELLGFHLEDGRFISVPLAFYPTLALATPEERGRFEVNGSSAYWPELDADIGVEGSGTVWNAGLRTGSWAKHSQAGSETGVPTSRQTVPPPIIGGGLAGKSVFTQSILLAPGKPEGLQSE